MEMGPIRNQKFDFLATSQCLVKIDRDNKKSKSSTDNQIYGLPANQFSPSAGTTLLCLVKIDERQQKIKIIHTN